MGTADLLKLKMRLARQGHQLTQQELAKKVGVSLRTYQRLESGQTPLDVGTLYKFCDCLKINFLELTSPELKPEHVTECSFYSNESEFLNDKKVDEVALKRIKQHISHVTKESPQKLLSNPENFAIINDVDPAIFIADIQTTVANNSLNRLSSHYNEPKWKTGSKFSEPISFVNAWHVALKNNFCGFKLNNIISNNIFEKYYLIINSDPTYPLAIGQVI